MIVVSDTSPICYLILIERIDLLPRLYEQVVIPQEVQNELADERSPAEVQRWIAQPPDWLTVQATNTSPDTRLDSLDPGERAAILLTEQLGADVLVMDEMLGRQLARARGLRVVGLLGILEEAGRLGWIDLPIVLQQLQQTSFRVSEPLIQQMLERYRASDAIEED
jgi:predicted nucleic acid-binding protein